MKQIVSIAALMAASLSVAQADVIASWTFENNAIAVNNSPAPSTGSGTVKSLGMDVYPTPSVGVTTDDVLAGSTGDTGVNGNADLTQIWHVRAQAPASGGGSEWLVEPCAYRDAGRRFRRKHSGLQQHHCQLRLVFHESRSGEPATCIHHGWQPLAQRAVLMAAMCSGGIVLDVQEQHD
jgi:hypothetical protein